MNDNIQTVYSTYSTKSIYDLELHEATVVFSGNLFIVALKVPNGWIYNSYDKSSNILSSVFIKE